jgi:hypothetical protein
VLSPGPAPRRGPLCPRGPRRTHRPTPRGGVLPGERCRPMLDYDVRCPGGGSVSFSGHLRNGQCRALTGFTSPTGCDPGRAGTRGWPPRAPDSPARTRRALRLLAVFRSADNPLQIGLGLRGSSQHHVDDEYSLLERPERDAGVDHRRCSDQGRGGRGGQQPGPQEADSSRHLSRLLSRRWSAAAATSVQPPTADCRAAGG